MTILRCTNDNGDKFDLDLLESVPFKLDISAIESGNIGQTFGVSSQKLTLPPSKTNNDFFGNLYDVGATPSTSFIKTVPCQVLQNGIEIFTGKLYLDSVVTDNQGNDLYNVVVVNETVDLAFLIKDTTFADLDFTSLNHTYTYGNITSSWDQTLEDGAVFYPLVNYGFDEENAVDTQIKGGGEPRSFSNYNSPVKVNDFKPAIRLRDALDAIFASVNYEYTSSIFSSGSYTDDIYMLATKDEKKGISVENPVEQTYLAYNNANQDYTDTQAIAKVNFNTEVFDNASNWDTTTSKFTVGADGSYQFKVQFKYQILNYNNVGDARQITYYLYKNGSIATLPDGTQIKFTDNLQGSVAGITNWTTGMFDLEVGDEIEVYVVYTESASGTQTFRIIGDSSSRMELRQGPTVVIGGNVNISEVFSDISVPDFLQGLIEKFNLVIEPVRNKRNTLRIETFNDWVDAGTIVDWSNKVDYNQKWEISHPLQNQPKNIKFTDVEDNIALTQYHKRTTGKLYGEYDYISESDLSKGEKTIGSFFAPTPIKGVDGAPRMILPALAEKDDSAQPYKRTKFAPRLLYHNGRQDADGLMGETQFGATSQGSWYFEDENGDVHVESDYGLASHLQQTEAVFATTRDLHFGNTISPGHYNYHQNVFNGQVKRTAFNDYWSFYINELYDVDSRLVTLNIFLEPTELPNIELNDKIHIDGHYYRINKIQGANVLREDSVQVEIIKTLPRKLTFPRRRVELDDTVVDITVDDASFSESGLVSYNDFNTGATYTGSAVTPASQRDGFQVYGSGSSTTVVWNTLKPTEARFTAQTNIGLNNIDESAETIDARGNGNQVENNTQVVRVEGTNNTVQQSSKFVQITGTNNTIGINVENSSIYASNTSSIDESSLSTIIGGDNTHITSSNQSVVIGQDITVDGGNNNIIIGNFDTNEKTITDLNNITALNLNRDLESIENINGDDYNGIGYVGNHKTIGSIYRDYYVITGSDGGSTDLSAEPYGEAHYIHLTWSGSTGTHTLNLPSTDDTIPLARGGNGYKREIRFFSDGTLQNNQTIFRLQPSGSDVIDGITYDETTNRPYDGITIFGTPGAWFVVQRKSV